MTPKQKDTAARILVDILQLRPDERSEVLSVVVLVLAGSGVANVDPSLVTRTSAEVPR